MSQQEINYAFAIGALQKMAEYGVSPAKFVEAAAQSNHQGMRKIASAVVELDQAVQQEKNAGLQFVDRAAAKVRKLVGKPRSYDEFYTNDALRGRQNRPDNVASRLENLWRKDKDLTETDMHLIAQQREISRLGADAPSFPGDIRAPGRNNRERADNFIQSNKDRGYTRAAKYMNDKYES